MSSRGIDTSSTESNDQPIQQITSPSKGTREQWKHPGQSTARSTIRQPGSRSAVGTEGAVEAFKLVWGGEAHGETVSPVCIDTGKFACEIATTWTTSVEAREISRGPMATSRDHEAPIAPPKTYRASWKEGDSRAGTSRTGRPSPSMNSNVVSRGRGPQQS